MRSLQFLILMAASVPLCFAHIAAAHDADKLPKVFHLEQ